MPLSAGQILHSRYRTYALPDRGGMGTMYCAWDIILQAYVVSKENVTAALRQCASSNAMP